MYPAYAVASLVNFLTTYKPGDSLQAVWTIALIWMGVTVLRSMTQFIAKYFGFQISEKVAIDATLEATKKLFLLDMAWHEKENSGNKVKRIQNAAKGLDTIIRIWFGVLIEVIVNCVAINIIIFRFDRPVVAVLVVFVVSYFLIANRFSKIAGQASFRVNAQEEEVSGVIFEAMSNIRTIKVMSVAKALFVLILKESNELFSKIKTRIRWYQSRNSFVSFWAMSFKIGIFLMIVYGFTHGRYEVGFLVLFNSYFSDLRTSMDELSEATQDFVSSRFAIARMKVILDEPIRIDDEKGKVALPENWSKISFKNVSFSYGDHKVLDDVSFEVHRGEKVGIVGLSGAGKSTIFKLLLKEREGFTGNVLFDELPIQKIKKSDYFRHVSVVLQDTEVFNFSFRDNVTIAHLKEQKNSKLLDRALKAAHINEFLKKLPQGLDTIIGEKGIKLSGGERQRLGIARAIFKEPKLLLLDEATSHLDLESEEKIQASLHEFFEQTTAIVIAHRLTTIKEMDMILVLEKGKIIESGSFHDLSEKRGRFFELWEKQKL